MPQNNQRSAHKRVNNEILRWILIGCGWFCIVCGVVGIFLPLVPTVPFLLLAAACFARSSEYFHTWLVEHNQLGPLFRDYLNSGGIPLKAKVMAICMVWVSLSASAFLFVQVVWVRALLMFIAVGISLYLLGLPTIPTVGEGDKANQGRG